MGWNSCFQFRVADFRLCLSASVSTNCTNKRIKRLKSLTKSLWNRYKHLESSHLNGDLKSRLNAVSPVLLQLRRGAVQHRKGRFVRILAIIRCICRRSWGDCRCCESCLLSLTIYDWENTRQQILRVAQHTRQINGSPMSWGQSFEGSPKMFIG